VSRRIAILGTGAIGAGLGADLTRAGLDVTYIEQWPDHVEAMRRYGIRVDGPDGSTTTPVRCLHLCEVATLRERFDLVLLVVKAYDTRWACELIKPALAPDGLVVGIQNGMTMDDVADIVGPERTLAAVVEIAANMWRPGVVERQTPTAGTWFGLGPYDAATAGREHEAAEVLSHTGTVELTDDIRSTKWMKLVGNAAEFLPSALLDVPLVAALHMDGMRAIMDAAGREALDVGLALGRRIVPIFGTPGIDREPPERYAGAVLDAILGGWSLPDTRVALLQDWQKGRRGEIDEINGLVVDEGRRLGIETPVNARLVDLAHRVERGELTPGAENVSLMTSALTGSAAGAPASVQ
jgi:2-dehydropantoate 2-reductase